MLAAAAENEVLTNAEAETKALVDLANFVEKPDHKLAATWYMVLFRAGLLDTSTFAFALCVQHCCCLQVPKIREERKSRLEKLVASRCCCVSARQSLTSIRCVSSGL